MVATHCRYSSTSLFPGYPQAFIKGFVNRRGCKKGFYVLLLQLRLPEHKAATLQLVRTAQRAPEMPSFEQLTHCTAALTRNGLGSCICIIWIFLFCQCTNSPSSSLTRQHLHRKIYIHTAFGGVLT